MNKKFELLRDAVHTYKVNHCDGNKNEKELLGFIDELEQLTIPAVVSQSEQLVSFLRQYQKACEIMHVNKIDAKNFVEQYKTN